MFFPSVRLAPLFAARYRRPSLENEAAPGVVISRVLKLVPPSAVGQGNFRALGECRWQLVPVDSASRQTRCPEKRRLDGTIDHLVARRAEHTSTFSNFGVSLDAEHGAPERDWVRRVAFEC